MSNNAERSITKSLQPALINDLSPTQGLNPCTAAILFESAKDEFLKNRLVCKTINAAENASAEMKKTFDAHPVICSLALMAAPTILSPKTRTLLGETVSALDKRLTFAESEAMDILTNKPFIVRTYEWNRGCATTGIARDSRTAKLYKDARSAVARVTTECEIGGDVETKSLSTAFAVTKDGKFMTNLKALKESSDLKLVDKFGSSHEATILGRDETNDLALLQLKNRSAYANFKPLELGSGFCPGYEASDDFVTFGHPYGAKKLHMSKGINEQVSWGGTDLMREDGMTVLPLTTRPGFFGAPIIDSVTGRVEGISRGLPTEEAFDWKLSIAVPSDAAKDLLEKAKR